MSALKKSLHAAEQKRADVARARRRWIREQGMLDPARLVFIDETATSTNMVRLRGRCPRGAVDRIGSAWTLENNHFRRRLAPRRDARHTSGAEAETTFSGVHSPSQPLQ